MQPTDARPVHCPYCGEEVWIIVEPGAGPQQYVEDCRVCCRPMQIEVTAGADDMIVSVRRDDD